MFTGNMTRRARRGRSHKPARAHRPCLAEVLEQRILLATVSWDGGGDGSSWHDRFNWVDDALPSAQDDVAISIATNPNVTINNTTGSVSIHSLMTDETLTISGGSLRVETTAQISANMTLSGGTLYGGTWSATGGATVSVTGDSSLNGVTLNADVVVVTAGYNNTRTLTVSGGLTLENNHKVTLQRWGSYDGPVCLNFAGTQTLGGTGEVVFADPGEGVWDWKEYVQGTSGTLTIGSGVTVRGLRGVVGNEGLPLVNQGTIRADAPGTGILVAASSVVNHGVMSATGGGMLDVNSTVTSNGSGILSGSSGTMSISGNSLGAGTNADRFNPQGTVLFDGGGTTANPQLLEAMSQDRGPATTGYNRNFAYGTLALSNNTRVQLVDQADNAGGAGPEALYVTALSVPAGTTLDLNGLNLYARLVQVAGTITGGSISQLADSGAILLNSPTPGSIAAAGELDEWSFFGRAGRSMTVAVNPGSGVPNSPPSPYLGWAKVEVLDASNNVLATGSNTAGGAVVTLREISLAADGTYRVRVHASAGHEASTGNYTVAVWDSTADVAALLMNQPVSGRVETPYSVDRWSFSAVAGQQVRFDLLGSTGSPVAFDLTGPEGWTGFNGLEGDSELITLLRTGAYTLTAHGTGGQQEVAYAFRLEQTTQTDLVLSTPYNGTFAGSGQAQLFRISVSASAPLLVSLDDMGAGDRTELYLKYGMPPTRADYAYRSATGADQQFLASMAAPGTWYALVYASHVPAPSTYTLLATASAVLLTDVTPDSLGSSADATLTLSGAGFDGTTAVSLVASGGTVYTATGVSHDSFTRLTATFAAGSVPAGLYTLQVANASGHTAALPDAFRILPGGEAKLVTKVIVPQSAGYHQLATIYIEYANTGTLAMPAPLLMLAAEQNGREAALLTLDQSRLTQGFWTSAIPEGFSNSIQILAGGQTPGVLQPGESFRVPVYYAGWQQPWDFLYPPISFGLSVAEADDPVPLDWSSLKASMRPSTIGAEAWEPIWANLMAEAGTTWGQYVSMLDNNAAYLAQVTHLPPRRKNFGAWIGLGDSASAVAAAEKCV